MLPMGNTAALHIDNSMFASRAVLNVMISVDVLSHNRLKQHVSELYKTICHIE
jgi:hypothetical protein